MPRIKYGLTWSDDYDDLQIELMCIKKGGRWKAGGVEVGMGLFHHYKHAQMLLWPEDYHHRWSDLELQEILQNTITVILGPKDCVSGDTKILNPITGEEPTIQWLCENEVSPTVMTMNGPELAEVPFLKGEKELFEVVCDDGSRFSGTSKHFVFSERGFVPVEQLRCGEFLLSYAPTLRGSILEPFQKVRASSGRSSSKTPEDCKTGYFSCFRPDGELLPLGEESFLCFPQPPIDVLERNRDGRSSGDSVGEPEYTRQHQSPFHPSNGYSSNRGHPSEICDQPLFFSGIPSHGFGSFQQPWRFQSGCFPKTACSEFEDSSFRIGSLGKDKVHWTRVQSIKSKGVGKYYDLTVPKSHHYFAQGLIHHNTGKTHVALVRYGLTDYFAFPNETLIIVSSTTLAALEGRVWGDMKSMFTKAKERYEWLPGVVIDSKHAITTDDINDESVLARDMRKGILCVPCKSSSGTNLGISSYVGMKQKRRRHLGDEFQFMFPAMMDSIGNMNSGDYKGVFVGNPIGQDDPLDKMSEPDCGWDSLPEPTKTTTWKNKKFKSSRTICLFGPDSPTNDFPDGPTRYPGLINSESIERVVAGYGKDSQQYYSQCLGVRKSGLNARRVITKPLCETFGAFGPVVWKGTPITKICAVDAAYGGAGGDVCVGGHIEFGLDSQDHQVILIHRPVSVPVSIRRAHVSPEDQISNWVKQYCENNNIPPENFFYDATGRGSLGPSLARIWSAQIQPVEFGGAATDRPVSLDVFIFDQKTGRRRLKTCKEHYSKFVTELWWSVRYAIESHQVRGMPEIVCDQGCAREWKEVGGTAGSRIEVETKTDMKERVGYSPDYFDWLVTAVEGARRRGFQISKLANEDEEIKSTQWLRDLARRQEKLRENHSLCYR